VSVLLVLRRRAIFASPIISSFWGYVDRDGCEVMVLLGNGGGARRSALARFSFEDRQDVCFGDHSYEWNFGEMDDRELFFCRFRLESFGHGAEDAKNIVRVLFHSEQFGLGRATPASFKG
jgi:hypothetical protein